MTETSIQEALMQPQIDVINSRIAILENKKELEAVTVTFHGGAKQFMERIHGTTKYLAQARKVIYDFSFLNLYNYNPRKIPEGCVALCDWLLKIDGWAHIDHPESFKKIMDDNKKLCRGTKIYLDAKLYMGNIPFMRADAIRDQLLWDRTDGIKWFNVLTITDPSGNKTQFLPSLKAIRIHKQQLNAKD